MERWSVEKNRHYLDTDPACGAVRTPRPTRAGKVGRGVLTAPIRMVAATRCSQKNGVTDCSTASSSFVTPSLHRSTTAQIHFFP
jgi:hypothetical protein